ncbi:MAG: DUF2946 family protein [Symbiopectobacterium sp.]
MPTHTQHHHSHGKPAATSSSMSSPMQQPWGHSACGYCGLLSHHPALFPENSPPLYPRFATQSEVNEPRPRHKIVAACCRPNHLARFRQGHIT